jgi:hypothetical protein
MLQQEQADFALDSARFAAGGKSVDLFHTHGHAEAHN